MIFVTVGTHEQTFDRLIKKIDELKMNGFIKEEVFIQTGFSTYCPQKCMYSKFISYKEMLEKIEESRIIITHGGPASFVIPLQKGKIPIVVPRQYKFNEHINNHQVEFVSQVEHRMKNIIIVYDINDLYNKIDNYEKLLDNIHKNTILNNESFCNKFKKEIEELLIEK